MLKQLFETSFGPMAPLDDDGRAKMIRNISRGNLFCMFGGLPGVVLNAWLLWPSVPTTELLAWSIAHAVLIVVLIARDLWVLSRPDTESILRSLPLMRATALAFGTSIGASAFLGITGSPASHGLLLSLVTLGLFLNVIVNSGVRELFWLGQIPMAAVSLAAFGFGGQADSIRHGAFLLAIIAFSCCIALVFRQYLERSLTLHQANVDLVADLVSVNERLAQDARTDSLTGLLNRSGFVNELESMMEDNNRPVRAGDPYPDQIGVMFLDLDRFKAINDSLGHAAGDEVLVQTARRLQSHVRPTDIVARIGGDEFTVAAFGIGSIAEARSLADRVHRAFAEPVMIAGGEHQLGASIGVSFGSLDSLDLDELLASADHALYEAKRNPAVGVEVFDDAARARLREKRDKQEQVGEALRHGQIRPYWQPVVNVDTGELRGLEGLARWEIDGEVRTAGSFITELLEAGLQDELAVTMLAATLDTRKAIDATIPLGLNLTPCQIERVVDRLLSAGSMDGLTIEITEQGVLSNASAARTLLAEARSRGCRVFLDDFGTGYSSLSLIADLPLDGLKIDGRFIASIDDPESFKIVADISEIGRRHGLVVVAEGVETVEQLEACAMLGVPLVQGFLISRPMSTADLKAMKVSGVQPWDHLFGPPAWPELEPSEQSSIRRGARDVDSID